MSDDPDRSIGPWEGEVAVRPGVLVFAGRIAPARPHVHATATIVRMRSGTVGLSDSTGAHAHGPAAIVPAGVVHGVVNGGDGWMVFLDPVGPASAAVRARVGGAVGEASAWVGVADAIAAVDIGGLEPLAVADRLVEAIGGRTSGAEAAGAPTLERVDRAVRDALPGPVRLPEIAMSVYVSSTHLGRVVRRATGLTFPAYVRWMRLQLAVEALRAGDGLTGAAHAAGFADSSHANRVCHEMFGLAPSEAAGHLTWI